MYLVSQHHTKAVHCLHFKIIVYAIATLSHHCELFSLGSEIQTSLYYEKHVQEFLCALCHQ